MGTKASWNEKLGEHGAMWVTLPPGGCEGMFSMLPIRRRSPASFQLQPQNYMGLSWWKCEGWSV